MTFSAGAPGSKARQARPMTPISSRWMPQIAAKPAPPIASSDWLTAPAPKKPTSATIAATPATAARMGQIFIVRRWRLSDPRGSLRDCGCRRRIAQKPPHQADQPGDHLRPQQPRIVARHAALVLGEAEVEHRRRRQCHVRHRLAAGQGEIVVLRALVARRADAAGEADAFANEAEPYRRERAPKPRQAPPRQAAPVPRHPVDEEQDVPRLFLHDRLE